jgi:hypothetical protein
LFGLAELAAWALGTKPLSETQAFQDLEAVRDCPAREGVIEVVCDPQRLGRSEGRASVFVLGGSSVQGYPKEVTPFPVYLAHLLHEQQPGAYQVHNLGQACRDSIYVRKCGKRIQGEPGDLYVIYSGHNDFMNYMQRHPRLRMASVEYPRLFALESLFAKSHFYSSLFVLAVRDSGEKIEPTGERERLSEEQWQRARTLTLEHYADNLTRVFAQARALEIEVVIATVVSNVSEFPHRRDAWDARIDREGQRTPWDAEYERGIRLLREGSSSEALAAFRSAKDQNLWGRAPTALNQQIRLLAESEPGVHLVDLEVDIRRVWGPDQHGCDLFGGEYWCDQFHPNDRLNQLIARRIGATILGLRRGGAGR